MRDHDVLLRELAHPLTRPDALRLTRSFTSLSTLACIIVGAAGTIPSISAGFSAASCLYQSRTYTVLSRCYAPFVVTPVTFNLDPPKIRSGRNVFC